MMHFFTATAFMQIKVLFHVATQDETHSSGCSLLGQDTEEERAPLRAIYGVALHRMGTLRVTVAPEYSALHRHHAQDPASGLA